ncbi:DUF72 domain-containing protein [Shewanella aestuarii]|uniref:DUF72 domain-containing protein n=1 Tax=Shewanella aestuarii TaxID=1028752 RepID=A0A6G9QM48_9GAMM|nr:DUF72 domain-containing protein [Shewanella aestuarii]QIR15664.1 DUF72 domain-containing protein [Shewanella aestuarii]
MWSQPQWQQSVYGHAKTTQRLEKYAQIFNTVEGNTTFYASPQSSTVKNWRDATDDNFRFTFKLPKQITHELKLQGAQAAIKQFFDLMEPLLSKTGIWKIQLPPQFGPSSLPTLAQFLNQLPQQLTYGVEVRHPAFFNKGETERQFNRLLQAHNCNRIIIDTRPIFSALPDNPAIIDAQQKKPNVPVHPIATADQPVVRFIGQHDLAINQQYFTKWVTKLCQWIHEGKQPYVFIHTPDNFQAPEQALALYNQLKQTIGQNILPNIELNPSIAHDSNQLNLTF